MENAMTSRNCTTTDAPKHSDSAPTPLSELTAGALLAAVLAALETRVDATVRRAVAEAMAQHATQPNHALTRRETARALGISLPTLDRLVRAGLPREFAGARSRFSLATVRAWLATRGREAVPKSPPRTKVGSGDDIDAAGLLGRSGLRLVGGER
ncbi:MAG: helix-turn-helix domain-containing protein [Myxococcales bacterium]|nr:helix-turn-helix domain-containing protein [Myxococcales bacterium]